MKFIITESQLEKRILDYILSYPEFNNLEEFDCSTMDWGEGVWVEEICFMENNWDDPIISYFPYPSNKKEYEDNEVFLQELDYLPALKLNDETSSTLSKLFGDRWKKPFQEWFESKFGYKVKSFFD